MRYIFYNIRNLAKNEKFIFAVMLVCIFFSAWIMTFSYGLFQNFNIMRISADRENTAVSPTIAEGEVLTYAEAGAYFDALSDDVLNSMEYIICQSVYEFEPFYDETPNYKRDDAESVFSRFVIRDGVYQTSPYIVEYWAEKKMITSGRNFTDAEEMPGSYSAIVAKDEMIGKNRKVLKNVILDDNTVLIYGNKYDIVGVVSGFPCFNVPFLSVPGETPIWSLSFGFSNVVKQSEYRELVKCADEVIPGKLIFPEFSAPDLESIYIYNNIMMISVFIAVLVIVNFAFLYRFIFGRRRQQLAIMRICGCTAAKAWAVCLGECVVICVPVFLIGMFTYIPFMHGVLADVFIYMEDSYKPWIYAAIFGVYLITLIVIMGIFLAAQIGKTLAEGRKEAA